VIRSRLYSVISVPFFAILYCYTAIGVLIVLILAWMRMKKPIIALCKFWAQSVFLLMGKKFEVRGLEKIRKDEKYILVANHASLFDIVAIVSFYPGISWFGHERLLHIPLFGYILKRMDYVPFKEPNYRNTREMIDQLLIKSQSNTVAMFPEGTRTLNGKINTFYRGFIYLYRTRDMEILPVTLNGFYDLKPKNRMYINFASKLGVVIHEPIRREALAHKSDNEIIATVKGIIESAYTKNQSTKYGR
jgi:1-acyl-sn-glycerol-3-phosphate acyltransferase